jgi:AraC family transcriptional regulator of adaptative response / DNA-3-methyladenine glycosylase II
MDDDHCYLVASSRDGRFDGAFVTAVITTGIYCRPSCPAMTPKRNHVRFFPTPAAAQEAGFRACKRCRPDAAPGSPDWNARADLVARAVRLIGDGVVEREGISGLSRRLGYSTRQLHRLVFAELGTGPLRLALAHRIQNARALLETTEMPVSDVAWASGFGSIRQFNARIREVYAATPTELRAKSLKGRAGEIAANPGTIAARLAFRPPIDIAALLEFLGKRAVPGVEAYDGSTYRRVLRLPRGLGVATVSCAVPDIPRPYVPVQLRLDDVRDYSTAIARLRTLLDLDADPGAVAICFADDPIMGPLVASRPGLRLPGAVDAEEMAVRAILGQQVSVAGARKLAGFLARVYGERLAEADGELTTAFPSIAALRYADPGSLPLPNRRAAALQRLANLLEVGDLSLDPGTDRDEAEGKLLATPGIGPWTASYIRMRALGDPDVFLASDLGVTRALTPNLVLSAESWKPWRSYATVHLWSTPNLRNGVASA